MRWEVSNIGTYLLNMMKVLKSEVVGDKGFGWGEEKREEGGRRGWRTHLHGNWANLAFPGRFCRWSRDEPTWYFRQLCMFTFYIAFYFVYIDRHPILSSLPFTDQVPSRYGGGLVPLSPLLGMFCTHSPVGLASGCRLTLNTHSILRKKYYIEFIVFKTHP